VVSLTKLHKGTEIIGAGNLNYKIGPMHKDEIGQLAKAFDQMTKKLKIITVSHDDLAGEVTQRKKAEEQIKKNLIEKEVLLKEIHHRVKNNLSIIASLLGLQAMESNNKQITNAFQESKNRIQSMAMVHEKLYSSDNFSEIPFKEYIKDMANELLQIYQNKSKVSLVFNLDDIYLNINIAIPCGLILNELITNAFKYAFQGRNKGNIIISLKTLKNSQYSLIVKDDGVGLPENTDIENPTTLGFQLIKDLSIQINGVLSITSNKGTKFCIIFPGINS